MRSSWHTRLFRSALTAARGGLILVLCTFLVAPIHAIPARTLADLSIEELMNESVTSVSKREQKLGDVAAAVAVLSNEDLRRSGFNNLPDSLRLVPGVNVGAVNSGQWAISARGFNNIYATKLLVLVDGRAVYSPLFAGVYWESQQPLLEDVDRIEVIRGPGATVWGANAVNGVINVVSRAAEETQGSFVQAGAGNGDERQGALRYGGAIGDATFYRLYAAHQWHGSLLRPDGSEADDAWRSWQSGVRVDHVADDQTRLTFQSDISESQLENNTAHGYDFNTLGRWTRQLANGGNFEVQAYYDRMHHDEAIRSETTIDTVDFALQHTLELGPRQTLVWGAGYRFSDVRAWRTDPSVTVGNPQLRLNLYSAFAQEEFRLVPDKLTLTAGVKLEHNDFTGFEIQPSARVVWKPTAKQSVWAAVSRAVRTPSAVEAKNVFIMAMGAPMPGPNGGLYLPVLTSDGNPSSEVLWSGEIGWRVQPSPRVSLDLATFYNHYSDIIGVGAVPEFIPGSPFGVAKMPFENVAGSDAWGGEATLTLSPTSHWRLSLSHSVLFVNDGGPSPSFRFDPSNQTVLRSSHDLSARVTLDLQLRHVGSFQTTDFVTTSTLPAYTEADARLAYRPTDAVELSLSGRNLLHRQHPEQGYAPYAITSEVPRRVQADITLRF